MVYDDLGRMTARSSEGHRGTWTYDASPGNSCVTMHSCGKLVQSRTLGGESGVDYQQDHYYDVLGRPSVTTTLLDVLYSTTVSYDSWGRVASELHQREGNTGKLYVRRYNEWGQLARIERGGQAVWTATELDASGRNTKALLGNGLLVDRDYNMYTGRLSGAKVGSQLSEGYQ